MSKKPEQSGVLAKYVLFVWFYSGMPTVSMQVRENDLSIDKMEMV